MPALYLQAVYEKGPALCPYINKVPSPSVPLALKRGKWDLKYHNKPGEPSDCSVDLSHTI